MNLLDNPIYVMSAGTLLVLAALGLYKIFIILKHKTFLDRKDLSILKIDPKEIGTNMNVLVRAIRPPFTLEVAVQHLGKEVVYYLVLPKGRARSLLPYKGLSEVGDYHLFHSGGEHLGAYFKDGELWPEVSFEKINFSKVNEVGEGAVAQFVFGKRKKEKMAVNFRIMASAPSMFQAREIMNALKGSFVEYNSVDSSGEEFIHLANTREFDSREQMLWGTATS